MRVFISWSGIQGAAIADAIRTWLRNCIQASRPFVSSAIEKGARWHGVISSELESTDVGIVCLTPSSVRSDWVLFEAGALARSVEKGRVCGVLFGLKKSDVTGPLSHFQNSLFDQDTMLAVLKVVNSRVSEPLAEQDLIKFHNVWWEDLRASVETAMSQEDREQEAKPERGAESMIEEILGIVRQMREVAARPNAFVPFAGTQLPDRDPPEAYSFRPANADDLRTWLGNRDPRPPVGPSE